MEETLDGGPEHPEPDERDNEDRRERGERKPDHGVKRVTLGRLQECRSILRRSPHATKSATSDWSRSGRYLNQSPSEFCVSCQQVLRLLSAQPSRKFPMWANGLSKCWCVSRRSRIIAISPHA